MMRIGLFIGTNLVILFVLNLIITVLGLNQHGMSWTPMILMAGVMGMAGSLISSLMSKSGAKRSSGAQVIENPSNEIEVWRVKTVHGQADKAGIGHPEVAIFPLPLPTCL